MYRNDSFVVKYTNKAVARFLNRIEETAVRWVCAFCGVLLSSTNVL